MSVEPLDEGEKGAVYEGLPACEGLIFGRLIHRVGWLCGVGLRPGARG